MSQVCLQGHACGRVQGVSYRAFTRQQAITRGVSGYARNLADGRVELLLCGDEKDVLALLDALQQGPPLATVTDIAVQPVAWRDCDGFRIE